MDGNDKDKSKISDFEKKKKKTNVGYWKDE